jgi:serine protein kinase
VLDQIKTLCEQGDYEFLQHKPDGGYHAHRDFLKQVRDAWLDELDGEVRRSTGLVEESQYRDLFDKYVTHVSLWLKGERYRDPMTGEPVDPDQTLLKRVEKILDARAPEEFRRNLISMIAAYAIDHPGEAIDHGQIFARYLERMRNAYFEEHRGQIAAMIRDMISALQADADTAARAAGSDGESHAPPPLDGEARERAYQGIGRLKSYGYCEHCARASLGELLEERYG